jgi:WD40 repeat protein
MVYRLFVSHSSRDSSSAVAVSRWLVENEPSLLGEIYLDIDADTGIAPGNRWKSELVRAVDRCEAVLCLISTDWESSAECIAEFRHAESLNKRIFCARLDKRAVGERTREWQFCDLFHDGDGAVTTIALDDEAEVVFSGDGLNRLLRGLREAGIGAEHFPWPPPGDAARAPYRGWQPMEDVDAAVFFGRDPQILRASDTLRGIRATGVEGLFVILGPSGVGKSSFLRAGLLPRLNRDRRNFVVADIVRPERAPLSGDQGLAHAIWQLRQRFRLNDPPLGEIKAACLVGDSGQLTAWLREALGGRTDDSATPTVVLPIDQAEELFAAEAGAEARSFLGLLGALLQSGPSGGLPVIAVATIRADRYESLQTSQELQDVRTREFGDLKPMPLTEFKEVITGPAARASAAGLRLRLEPQLVEQLLADAVGGADSLPLLALTLSRLYLDYGSTEALTLANYQLMGGVQRIVTAEIDTLLAGDLVTRAEQLEILRTAFIPWLATVDPDTELVSRRLARWRELPAASHELVDAMVARRLLVKDVRDGETVVEVALESLFRQWDSLAQWIRDQAEDLKAADNLDHAAADWERNDRGPEWLIGGLRLAAAEKLSTTSSFVERARHASSFLQASREHEDAEAQAELRDAQQRRDVAEAHATALRKRAKVLRAVLALTLVVALVAVGGLIYAEHQRQAADTRSREALAERLTSQAQSILVGGQPGTALEAITKLLAAQRIATTPDLGPMLTALIRTARLQRIIQAPDGQFLSADGTRVVALGEAGAQLVDTATGSTVGTPFAQASDSISSSGPDNRYLATVSNNNEIRVWDSVTGQLVGQPIPVDERPSGVAVSADGRRVAADDANATVRLWDLETGRPIGGVLPGRAGETLLAFSPNGRRLASTDNEGDVRLWDSNNAAPLGKPLHSSTPGYITTIAFSPDSREVAVAATSILLTDPARLLQIWDVDTGASIEGPPSGNSEVILSIAFSRDGSRIATGGSDKRVRLWDAHTGQSIGEPLTLHDQVTDVAFAHGSDHIVAIAGDTVHTYNADPHAELLAEMGGSKLYSAGAQAVTFSVLSTLAGPRIVVFDERRVRVLNAETGEQVGQAIDVGPQKDFYCDVSPDGRWLVLWRAGQDVRIIDATTGRWHGKPLGGHQDVVNAVQFSPDSQVLATASDDKTIRLWDWRSGRQIGEPMTMGAPVQSVEFSGDGRHLLSRSSNELQVWDTTTRATVGKPIPLESLIAATAISPDGERVVATTSELMLQFDMQTGETLPPLKGHTLAVSGLAFGVDGRYLVSGGRDETVRFWDTTSGRQLGDSVNVTAQLVLVQVSRDGRRVFVTEVGGSEPVGQFTGLRVSQLPAPPAWADGLCDKLARNPTDDQWDAWVSPAVDYIQICPDST